MTADNGSRPASGEPGNSDDDSDETDKSPARGGGSTGYRPFPRRTINQALRVPLALREHNGGNEWATREVAKALGVGATSANFFYLTAASRDYGFTVGTRDSATIKLTDLGRQAVYWRSDEEESRARLDGFLRIESFRRVLEHFGGNALPEYRFLENTLHQTFGLEPAFHQEFLEIFNKNCRSLGIGAEYVLGETVEGSGSASARPTERGSITVAEPKKTSEDAPICFVIMPFREREDRHEIGFFDEVLTNLFTPAAVEAGFKVKTARRLGSDVIQATIVNDLLEADLVLADLTEHNPNVLFELTMFNCEGYQRVQGRGRAWRGSPPGGRAGTASAAAAS